MRPDRDVRVFVKARAEVVLPVGSTRLRAVGLARYRVELAKELVTGMEAGAVGESKDAWYLVWSLLVGAEIEG